MPLVSCPECGHKVSEEAKSCPGCGYRISRDSSVRAGNQAFWALTVLVGLIALATAQNGAGFLGENTTGVGKLVVIAGAVGFSISTWQIWKRRQTEGEENAKAQDD